MHAAWLMVLLEFMVLLGFRGVRVLSFVASSAVPFGFLVSVLCHGSGKIAFWSVPTNAGAAVACRGSFWGGPSHLGATGLGLL